MLSRSAGSGSLRIRESLLVDEASGFSLLYV